MIPSSDLADFIGISTLFGDFCGVGVGCCGTGGTGFLLAALDPSDAESPGFGLPTLVKACCSLSLKLSGRRTLAGEFPDRRQISRFSLSHFSVSRFPRRLNP
jgi:hypothetical protein